MGGGYAPAHTPVRGLGYGAFRYVGEGGRSSQVPQQLKARATAGCPGRLSVRHVH